MPAAILLVAVPIYRVHQVPLVSPGFDPQEFVATFPQDALKTADLYLRANDLYVAAPLDSDSRLIDFVEDAGRPPSDQAIKWLTDNADALDLTLEATKHPVCQFRNPAGRQNYLPEPRGYHPISLVIVSGRQLEAEGKLDEALDRYLPR